MKIKYLFFLILLTNCSDTERVEINDFPYSSNIIHKFTKISFDKQIVDFGDVKDDTVLTAKYSFKNTGSDTLFVSYILPDCNCTDFSIEGDTLESGKSGFISLKMNTSGKSGRISSNTRLEMNTKDRFYHLTMIANIQNEN